MFCVDCDINYAHSILYLFCNFVVLVSIIYASYYIIITVYIMELVHIYFFFRISKLMYNIDYGFVLDGLSSSSSSSSLSRGMGRSLGSIGEKFKHPMKWNINQGMVCLVITYMI